MSKETRMANDEKHDAAPTAARPIARPLKGVPTKDSITPEMRALADALAHPKGDPYENGRKLGFYCEQCG